MLEKERKINAESACGATDQSKTRLTSSPVLSNVKRPGPRYPSLKIRVERAEARVPARINVTIKKFVDHCEKSYGKPARCCEGRRSLDQYLSKVSIIIFDRKKKWKKQKQGFTAKANKNKYR